MMAYARFGEGSQVYLYANTLGYCCCGCRLNPSTRHGWYDDQVFQTPQETLEHAYLHRDAGHGDDAIARLEQECGITTKPRNPVFPSKNGTPPQGGDHDNISTTSAPAVYPNPDVTAEQE